MIFENLLSEKEGFKNHNDLMNFLSPKLLEKHAKNKFKNILPFSKIFCCLINRLYLICSEYNEFNSYSLSSPLNVNPLLNHVFDTPTNPSGGTNEIHSIMVEKQKELHQVPFKIHIKNA